MTRRGAISFASVRVAASSAPFTAARPTVPGIAMCAAAPPRKVIEPCPASVGKEACVERDARGALAEPSSGAGSARGR